MSRAAIRPQGRTEPGARWLALAGVAGPVLFVAVFTLAGFLRPGYSPVGQDVSELGARPGAWLQNANFAVFGVLLVLFTVAFHRGMRPVIDGGRLKACFALLTVSGLGVAAAGYFHVPTPQEPPGLQALHAALHMLCFSFGTIPVIVVLFVAGGRMLRVPGWRGYGRYSVAAGWVALALLPPLFFFANPASPLQIGGLLERVLVLDLFGWHALLGLRLFTRREVTKTA